MTIRRAAVATLAAALATAASIAPASALEVDPQAPVVVDDALTMWPGEYAWIDVLANDTDPAGDDLALCRLPPRVGPRDISVTVWETQATSWPSTPGTLTVATSGRATGTHVVEYYVCNHSRLTLAHLTVTIRPVQPVDVSPADVPDRILVTNHNDQRVFFIASDPSGCNDDVRAGIAPGATRSFKVRHHRLRWIAMIGDGIADLGWVRGVPLTRPPAPPGSPDASCYFS
jgi:hypothetical protein